MPHAKIATKQATLTLQQLHAELAGKILDNKREANRLREAMAQVEAVIKMLDPSYSLRRLAVRRRTPNAWFKRGTMFRSALDMLRRAEAPMTVSEIAQRMLDAKGIQDAPRSAVEKLEGAVRAALHGHSGRAVVVVGTERPVRWALAKAATSFCSG